MRLGKARSALALVRSAIVEWLAARLPNAMLGAALLRRLRDNPNWLPPDSIAVAFALNARLRALEDPAGANRWLHERWIGIPAEMWRDLKAADSLPSATRGFTYVSMGTGTPKPLRTRPARLPRGRDRGLARRTRGAAAGGLAYLLGPAGVGAPPSLGKRAGAGS